MLNLFSLRSFTFFLSLVLLNFNSVSFASRSLELDTSSLSERSDSYIAQSSVVILQDQGVLQRGDRSLDDGSLYHTYTFNGRAGQRITINLNSNEFDTYLILLDPDGEKVAENDDSQGVTNSSITVALPQTGEYLVIVNGYDQNSRGSYELVVLESGGNTSTSSSSNDCQSVINEAVYRIERLPGISVPLSQSFEISDLYRNPPPGRVMGYIIGMEGSAVDNVFNSPVMMENIAISIFDACNRVGLVEFGIYQTGYKAQIGWSSNGPIIFDCVRDDWHGSGETQINWGQQICGF